MHFSALFLCPTAFFYCLVGQWLERRRMVKPSSANGLVPALLLPLRVHLFVPVLPMWPSQDALTRHWGSFVWLRCYRSLPLSWCAMVSEVPSIAALNPNCLATPSDAPEMGEIFGGITFFCSYLSIDLLDIMERFVMTHDTFPT